jgi:hypothetical protein
VRPNNQPHPKQTNTQTKTCARFAGFAVRRGRWRYRARRRNSRARALSLASRPTPLLLSLVTLQLPLPLPLSLSYLPPPPPSPLGPAQARPDAGGDARRQRMVAPQRAVRPCDEPAVRAVRRPSAGCRICIYSCISLCMHMYVYTLTCVRFYAYMHVCTSECAHAQRSA